MAMQTWADKSAVKEINRLRAIVEAQATTIEIADKVVAYINQGVDSSNGVKFVWSVQAYADARAKLAGLEGK